MVATFDAAQILLALFIRIYLMSQNAARDRAARSTGEKGTTHSEAFDDVFIIVKDEKGQATKRRIHRAYLDLTDKQNREFRYVL